MKAMTVDDAIRIARDPLATHVERNAALHVLAAEVPKLRNQLAEHQRLRTLGGPPPACDMTWGNRELPREIHRDYRGRI